MVLQTVAVGFLSKADNTTYDWCVLQVPVQTQASGGNHILVTKMNLDDIFVDRDTSIRFKGYSRNGRPMYVETNMIRKVPRDYKSTYKNIYFQEHLKRSQNEQLRNSR